MAKRNASLMSAHERACVFEIIASKFNEVLSTAMRQTEEDGASFDSFQKLECLEQAALIDPELLPKSKKAKFVGAFGAECGKFEIDTTHMLADTATEYPVRGAPGVKGVAIVEVNPATNRRTKTFIDAKSFASADDGANEDDDEMVVIRIKTGKGGRQQFRVPKKVAKDMVGCD